MYGEAGGGGGAGLLGQRGHLLLQLAGCQVWPLLAAPSESASDINRCTAICCFGNHSRHCALCKGTLLCCCALRAQPAPYSLSLNLSIGSALARGEVD